VDKGLFAGGALYNYAVGLTAGTITPETVQSIAAAFGANEMLTPGASSATPANVHSGNYVFQMGFYDGDNGSIRQDLIDAQAYAADPSCTAERDEALRDVFATWERGIFARVIFYAHATHAGIGAAGGVLADQLGPLHQMAEGLGLAQGFYGLPDPEAGPLRADNGGARIVSDAELQTILELLHLPVGMTPTLNLILSDSDELDELQDAIDAIGDVYGWDAAEIDDHRDSTNQG
jgi:hypothetical protein